MRDRGRAEHLAHDGPELHEGDVLDAGSLEGAGRDVDIAYYLVHSMGRGGDGDFEERERKAARDFAEMAASEGVARVVYLGGLGDEPGSKHLRSRPPNGRVLGSTVRRSPTSVRRWSSARRASRSSPCATSSSGCRR